MSKVRVMLDAGHGGKDPGAMGNGEREKDWTLRYSKEIGRQLEEQGIEVLYTRKEDKDMSLTERWKKANKEGVDLYISIHLNAFKEPQANGVETFYSRGSVEGKRLAKAIQSEIRGYYKDRGIKEAGFSVIKNTKMPAVLIELGFITNKSDIEVTKRKQREIAESIVKGIMDYKGLKYGGSVIGIEENKKASSWALEALEWGMREGITDGSRPGEMATREEIVTMLYRLEQKKR